MLDRACRSWERKISRSMSLMPTAGTFSWAEPDASGGRRRRALTMSIAVFAVMTRSQFTSGPPAGSKEEQARHARRKTSWTTSSARSGSTTIRRARASRRAWYAAYAAAMPHSVQSWAHPSVLQVPGPGSVIGPSASGFMSRASRRGPVRLIGERCPFMPARLPIHKAWRAPRPVSRSSPARRSANCRPCSGSSAGPGIRWARRVRLAGGIRRRLRPCDMACRRACRRAGRRRPADRHGSAERRGPAARRRPAVLPRAVPCRDTA
jgi:hypothetical protein